MKHELTVIGETRNMLGYTLEQQLIKRDSPIGEKSAITKIQFLKNWTEDYQRDLKKESDEYEEQKRKTESINRKNLTSISNLFDDTVSALEKEFQQSSATIQRGREKTLVKYYADLQSFLANPIFKTRSTSMGGTTKIVEEVVKATHEEETVRNQWEELINKQKTAYNMLRDRAIKTAESEANRDREKENNRYNSEREKNGLKFRERVDEIISHYKVRLNDTIKNEDVGKLINEIHSSVPASVGYNCATVIPDILYLGDISMDIGSKGEVFPAVAHTLTTELEKALSNSSTEQITVSLPYCQRLDEGISLVVDYSAQERTVYQSQLQKLLLRMFMMFPAGKLEATMIDPLELGETFAMFTKLGEEEPRIIGTKIWSQEKDINESISILRQKLETMTQAYGGDRTTRLKKEPVRVLAITDFPTGFSQSALRDLQAIVRKGVAYGVCVFIWANNEEIKKLQMSQLSVFNEIKDMLHTATARGNILEFEGAKYRGMRLAIDEMKEQEEHRQQIISTLIKGIHNSKKRIEHFADMYDDIEDPNNWFGEDTVKEISIPIGIRGAGSAVKITMGKADGSTVHHALIAGQTGSGKSTLLHTIIMGTLLNYTPEEAQMYLVDFKEGVEFKTYSKLKLPSIKVVAIDCEREFGRNVLKELHKEMKRRYSLFKREADREEISEYREVTGNKIPKIIVIFDEVQELFRGTGEDNITKECETLLSELLTLGRAAGIHFILASQNFNLIPSLKPVLFSHAAIRIAIKGSEDSANSVLGEANPGAKQLQDGAAGAAVYNEDSGKESANIIFQVGYLEKEQRAKLLNKLSALQNNEVYAKKYKEKTRILLTNAEDDLFNVFNQLILTEKAEALDENKTKYGLIIGEGFEINRKFRIGIAPQRNSNLLIIGKDEKRAASIFYFSILSLLYGELGNPDVRKDNQLIHLIDLSVEEEYAELDNTSFQHLNDMFPKQVKRADIREMESLVSDTYGTLQRRIKKEEGTEERLFLMFFGINRAHRFVNKSLYQNEDHENKTTLRKLVEIIKNGAEWGINCIFWGESLSGTVNVIGNNVEREFAQRIAFSTDKETMERLVMEESSEALRPTTAVYMDIESDVKNTHFRSYEIPAKTWVKRIASVYSKLE